MTLNHRYIIFAATSFLVSIATYAQPLPLDPEIKIGKLKNGFTYYIRKNTEPKDRAQLYLVIKAGSILENDQQLGLAHFMEHMSFNGTANFPKNELVDYLQKSGVRFGADLNAYTIFDETVYQLPIPTDDAEVFRNGMQIMRDWAGAATLDTMEINKERGVILEEKRLGGGAQKRMSDQYLPILLNGSRYSKRLPIGTDEVLKNFKPEVITSFYKDWYRPSLQALIVVGDIDVNAVEKMIKQKFTDLKNPVNEKPRTKYAVPLTGKNQFKVVTDKEFPYTVAQVIIKHPGAKLRTHADYGNLIRRTLFNDMLSARISELSQVADPAFVQASGSIDGFLGGLDIFSAMVVAKPGELEKGFKGVWSEAERVKQFGFTAAELARAKQQYLSRLETMSREKDRTPSENLVKEYTRHFLNEEAVPGIAAEYALVKKMLPSIGLSNINAIAKQYITEKNRDIIIMSSGNDQQQLPREQEINGWITSITKSKLQKFVDNTSDRPLLSSVPVAGKITGEQEIKELGITKLELSNGVKVFLKPTDFKNDEVLFRAYSEGGTSLYSDEDFQSAANAAAIINNSGVGEFNAIELSKILAGKVMNVEPYMNERSEGIEGSSSVKDLETALQLVHLYFTGPRKDSSVFSNNMQRSRSVIMNRANDPANVFSDTVSAVIGNYNIRRTGPNTTKLEQVDFERAYAIYRERFANAGDFTFTFVGNVDKEKIRPLLEQYLGSLPAAPGNETAVDLGIRAPAGKIEKTVSKGTESKATVRLMFSGDYAYNMENNIQLDGLGEVLNIKLTERLRELEGGVYSPQAKSTYSKWPVGRYAINIYFGCAPENVEKLIAATQDEIRKLQDNGGAAVDVQKFIIEENRQTEIQLKDNAFWLNYLSGSFQNNDDPVEVLNYIESLKKATTATIQESAKKYLSGDNFIRFVLMPGEK